MSFLDSLRTKLALLIAPRNIYEGAQYSTRRSYLRADVKSARFDADFTSLEELRKKARYFERNNAVVNRLADLWEQYTVGSGLVVQPASSDAEWNARARDWWSYWAELPDIGSRQPLGTLLGMVSRGWFIDGEQFLLTTKGESGIPRLQSIEAHLVSSPPTLKASDNVLDGVRVETQTLRPISYFIRSENLSGSTQTWTEVPADGVIHVFEPSRPGQLRGVSLLHPVINDLHDLDDLQMLEMRAAKDAARVSKVVKNQSGEVPDLARLRASRVSGSVTLSGGTTATKEVTQYYRDVLGEDAVLLRPGDDYEQFNTTRPSVATKEYWRFLAEKVCVGVGIPYVLAFPDSMQGTVYRGALDSAASFFALRSAVMQAVVQRIYGYVIGWARYKVPTLVDAPADWRKIRISPPRAVNVDVGRNSQALLSEIGGGVSTYAKAYSQVGEDWRDSLRQKAEEARFIRDIAEEFDVDPAEISNIQVDRPERISSETTQQSNAPETVPVEGDEVVKEEIE